MLSLALGFGPQVLFLLQTFGHLQVLLHQTALVDVRGQVALDWKSQRGETFLDETDTREDSLHTMSNEVK